MSYPAGRLIFVRLRYNYRLYPTAGQRVALARAFGCARVVFNDAVRVRRDAYENGLPFVCDAELSKLLITEAKKTRERCWLGEVSVVVLQQALADACTAYRNFFAGLTGERKGPKIGAPRFRSRKDSRQAIRFTRNARFRVGDMLTLPKIGDVRVVWSRPQQPRSLQLLPSP
jgi:putative transposase